MKKQYYGSNANWLINMNGGKLTIKDVTITNFFKSINQSGTKAGIITSNSKIDLNAVVLSNNVIQTSLGVGEEKSTIYTGVVFSNGEINIENVTAFNNKINNTLGNTLADLRKLADWGCVIGSFNATRISNSNFYNNSGSRSSVVYAHTLTTLDVLNSRFENNTASYCGGVFLVYLNTTTHISNSIFIKNDGTNAGGIIYQQDIQTCMLTIVHLMIIMQTLVDHYMHITIVILLLQTVLFQTDVQELVLQ